MFVFLHAFASSGRSWDEVAATLAPRHRCVALDLLGFGRSQSSGEVTGIANHVNDVIQALGAYAEGGYVLAGHSMGEKIALAAAIARPAGLKGVLLAAPSLPSPEPMSEAERHETLTSFGDNDAAAKRMRRIAKRPLGDDARARSSPTPSPPRTPPGGGGCRTGAGRTSRPMCGTSTCPFVS